MSYFFREHLQILIVFTICAVLICAQAADSTQLEENTEEDLSTLVSDWGSANLYSAKALALAQSRVNKKAEP